MEAIRPRRHPAPGPGCRPAPGRGAGVVPGRPFRAAQTEKPLGAPSWEGSTIWASGGAVIRGYRPKALKVSVTFCWTVGVSAWTSTTYGSPVIATYTVEVPVGLTWSTGSTR